MTAVDQYVARLEKEMGHSKASAHLIEEYRKLLQEVPGADEMSLEQLEDVVGEPAALNNISPDISKELAQRAKRTQRFRRILLAIVIAVAVIAVILGTIHVVDAYNFNHGHYEDTLYESTPEIPPETLARY